MRRRRGLLALAAPTILPAAAFGQTTLPDRSVRLLAGFTQSGGTDLLARALASGLERRTGRHVSVDNRPGGTGAAVGEALKRGPPDGTLIGFMPSTTLASKLAVISIRSIR